MISEPGNSIYQTPKCFVTYGTLGHVDTSQGYSSRKPWSVLKDMGFIQRVDLILPQESAANVRQHLQIAAPTSYSRVKMTLGQILERQFFRSYIKDGHVLMLTSGKKAIDDTFVLQDGTLMLYLGKESYEKAGLVGTPYGAKGNRKLKPRWVISLDLKSSSMVHGKKGFDRLLYACENVFSQPLTWLFSNLSAEVPSPDPLQQYSPEQVICHPNSNEDIETTKVAMHIDPSIVASGNRPAMETAAVDLYEWLSLIRLDSPRIKTGDSIDAYLSRYDTPDAGTGSMKLCVLSWQGLINSTWLHQLAMSVVMKLPRQAWFAIAATELSGSLSGASREVMLLRPDQPKGEYLMWEVQGSE